MQILLELKARGLVRSVRGKEGGYRLAKPPAEITFGDVLRGIHGEVFATPALSNGKCPPELHRAWSRLKTAAENASDAVNFQQLVEEGAEKERMFYICPPVTTASHCCKPRPRPSGRKILSSR